MKNKLDSDVQLRNVHDKYLLCNNFYFFCTPIFLSVAKIISYLCPFVGKKTLINERPSMNVFLHEEEGTFYNLFFQSKEKQVCRRRCCHFAINKNVSQMISDTFLALFFSVRHTFRPNGTFLNIFHRPKKSCSIVPKIELSYEEDTKN